MVTATSPCALCAGGGISALIWAAAGAVRQVAKSSSKRIGRPPFFEGSVLQRALTMSMNKRQARLSRGRGAISSSSLRGRPAAAGGGAPGRPRLPRRRPRWRRRSPAAARRARSCRSPRPHPRASSRAGAPRPRPRGSPLRSARSCRSSRSSRRQRGLARLGLVAGVAFGRLRPSSPPSSSSA